MKVTCLVDAKAQVGEGAVWDGVAQVLWWTDINGRAMHRYDPATGEDRAFDLGMRVGCFALRERGGFIVAAEHGFWMWDPEASRLEHLLDVEQDRPDNRMNDGACDRQGRFFASSMNLATPRKATGACWRLSPDYTVELVADGLHIGNGIAFAPAGDQFFLADTTQEQVWIHRYNGQTGHIGTRSNFADLADMDGLPDGATVDFDGFYWLAAVRGGRLYRFAPNGRLDRTIDLPISSPTRPMFGGADLDRLFVTSIRVDGEALSGGLFVIDGIGCRGVAEPRFAG
jgi:sugar lactone lactonase YvrE